MADWAALKAAEIVDKPGIVQVFHRAGYCKPCNQILAGAAVDLTALKAAIAEALREARTTEIT